MCARSRACSWEPVSIELASAWTSRLFSRPLIERTRSTRNPGPA
jgi:hypothetical protein